MHGATAAITATAAVASTFLLLSGCGAANDGDASGLSPEEAAVEARRSEGWSLLSPGERRALSALLDGRNNPWSPRGREALRDAVAEARWATCSGAEQAETLRGLWHHPGVLPRNVATLALAGRRPRAAYAVVGDVTLGPTDFPGGTAEARRDAMHVDGRVIPIDGPTKSPVDGALLSPEAVAEAVVRLPASARAEIQSVVLVPFRNPDDARYAVELGIPDFRTFMVAGPTGRILVFPRLRPRVDPTDMLLHEVAHVWTLRNLATEQWVAWSAARDGDGHAVSEYAGATLQEDIAETAAVYVALEDEPGLAEVRAMFEARFALLDAWAPRADRGHFAAVARGARAPRGACALGRLHRARREAAVRRGQNDAVSVM